MEAWNERESFSGDHQSVCDRTYKATVGCRQRQRGITWEKRAHAKAIFALTMKSNEKSVALSRILASRGIESLAIDAPSVGIKF